MKISETKTDISTRAFVSEIEDIEIQGSTGIIAAAKRRFLVRADALANIRPTTRDRIYEDGRWREIIRIDKTSIGPMPVTYVFYAR